MEKQTESRRLTLILLWIMVMLNMIFADIFSIMIELTGEKIIDIPFEISSVMAIAAILTNIPIGMILLSWVLPVTYAYKTNQGAAILTIIYIIGGGVWLPHYLIIAAIECSLLVAIIVLSQK